MTAQEIKPYLFWIICGVILLAEIGVIVTVSPSVDDGPDTVQEAKDNLDREVKRLTKENLVSEAGSGLHARAEANLALNGGPALARSAEDTEAMQQLLRGYLIVGDWTADLRQRVNDYNAQLNRVLTDLVERTVGRDAVPNTQLEGRFLQTEVSDRRDPGAWYDDYRDLTEQLLQKAIAGGVVAVEDDEEPDLQTDARVRQLLGFQTIQGEYDDSQRPSFTVQFNIAAIVVEALIDAEPSWVENPLVGELELPVVDASQRAVITQWNWSAVGDRVLREVVPSGDAWTMRLHLTGSPAALLAASNALSNIRAPVVVETGATWRRANLRGGAKLGQGDLPMVLEIDLAVLDFRAAQAQIQGGAP